MMLNYKAAGLRFLCSVTITVCTALNAAVLEYACALMQALYCSTRQRMCVEGCCLTRLCGVLPANKQSGLYHCVTDIRLLDCVAQASTFVGR